MCLQSRDGSLAPPGLLPPDERLAAIGGFILCEVGFECNAGGGEDWADGLANQGFDALTPGNRRAPCRPGFATAFPRFPFSIRNLPLTGAALATHVQGSPFSIPPPRGGW
jgi:hypothetical protein